MKSLEPWGKTGFSPFVACRHTSVISAPEMMMLPEPAAVCTVGVAKAPPRLPSWCQWARQPRRFQTGLPLVVCGSPGQQKSLSPKGSPSLQALPYLLESPCVRQASLRRSGLCRWLPGGSCTFRVGLSGVFPAPVHPSLLLACFPAAHHPKEKSLGLVQQGPLSPLTSRVCWHCDWWSSP